MRSTAWMLSPESPQKRPFAKAPRSSRALALAFLALASTIVVPLAAQPPTTVDLSEEAVVELPIGSPLLIEWGDAIPEEATTVTLLDDVGTVVTSLTPTADGNGLIPPTLLWGRTGVVGCDEGAQPQPSLYRFERFEEASDALQGRLFKIEAHDSEHNFLAEVSVALVPPPTFYYFSDGSACPRSHYQPSETLYLSTSNGGDDPGTLRTFVLEPAGEVPCVGDTLADLRSQYEDQPQQLAKQPGDTWVVLGALADGADVVDPYGCRELWTVVRPHLVSDELDFQDDDLFAQQGPVVPCLDLPAPSWAHSGAHVDPWKPDDFGPCPPDED